MYNNLLKKYLKPQLEYLDMKCFYSQLILNKTGNKNRRVQREGYGVVCAIYSWKVSDDGMENLVKKSKSVKSNVLSKDKSANFFLNENEKRISTQTMIIT